MPLGTSAAHVALFAVGCMQYQNAPHPFVAKYGHLGNTICWGTTIHAMFAISPTMASVVACSTLPAVLLTGSFQAALRAVSGGGVAGAAASVAAANGGTAPGAENAANPMTQAMIGFPALAGIVIVALRILSSYALPEASLAGLLPHSSVSIALIAAQMLMVISGAVCTLIYPAPIVANVMIGPSQLAKEADRMWGLKGVGNDRVAIRLTVPSIPTTSNMADYVDFTNLQKDTTTTTKGGSGANFALPTPIPSAPKASSLDVGVFIKVGGRNLATGEPALMGNRWVVYFGGNGEVMEGSWSGGLSIAHALDAHLIMYNPRGVGSSTGIIRSADGLKQDAKSVVEYVAKLMEAKRWGGATTQQQQSRGKSFFSNVTLEKNFMLFGHSIGGGMAAYIGSEFLPDAPLVLDRTFSSLVDAAKALSPVPIPALVEFVVPRVFGDMDNVAAWNTIARTSPQNNKQRLIIYSEADQIIKYKLCSIARLADASITPGDGAVRLKDAESRILRVEGNVADPHNSQLWQFHNADIIRRHLVDLFLTK